MPPMVPMPVGTFGHMQRIGRRSPLSGRRLTRQHEPGDPGSGKFFQMRRQILATSGLRVRYMSDVVMKIASRDGPALMAFPPDRKQLGNRLTAPVALLGLSDPIGWVLAAQRKQGVSYPSAPLLKASKRAARHDAMGSPTPAPDRQRGGEQFRSPVGHVGPDVGRERSRLGVFRSRVELDGDKAAGKVLRYGQPVTRQDHQGGGV